MSLSEVEISNLALAMIGAEAIKSFTEENERARLCKVQYAFLNELLQEDFEWRFNTDYEELAALNVAHPVFGYVYANPSRSIYPRRLLDASGAFLAEAKWELYSDKIATDLETPWLVFSFLEETTNRFPSYYVNALATRMAAELAPRIVQEKKLRSDLVSLAELRLNQAIQKEAYLGNRYIEDMENPDKDSFVTVRY